MTTSDKSEMLCVGGARHMTPALDLDAYLARIDLPRPRVPDADALRGWQRAHITAIGFDNADVALGRGISLALDDVSAKLVGDTRGGYCHEHVALAGAALEALGYTVTRVLGRVRPDRGDGPPSHATLVVGDVDGERWLADVGFGAASLEPLALREGEQVTLGGWRSALTRDDRPGSWRLLDLREGAWHASHAFDEREARRDELVAANHGSSTNPASPFVGTTVAMTSRPDARVALVGCRRRTTTPDGRVTTEDLDPDTALTAFLDATGPHVIEPDDRQRLRDLLTRNNLPDRGSGELARRKS